MKERIIEYNNYRLKVEYTPNVIEQWLGVKPKTELYYNRWPSCVDGVVWFDSKGNKIGRRQSFGKFIQSPGNMRPGRKKLHETMEELSKWDYETGK